MYSGKWFVQMSMILLLFSGLRSQWQEVAVEQEIAGMDVPAQVEMFNPRFHFPPVNQDTTSICWSFSTISFIETEMYRLGLPPVKLAVVYPVYYTFIEKARAFVRSKGTSRFEPGDLFSSVYEIVNKYGIVPESVYRGRSETRKTYNHDSLYAELKTCMASVKKEAEWDEAKAVTRVSDILNRHLGSPPSTFEYEGKSYTPVSFLNERVKLPWHDYLVVTSFIYAPYDSFCVLKVPDNWRNNEKYFNVTLPVFYQNLVTALKKGYSVAIDGDIGEPGRYGISDVAFIPSFDIAPGDIDQTAREYRFDKGLTTDDHLMHIVGFTRKDSLDWFLVKDSWRDAWEGEQKGYFFYRGDFVKLKVLAYLVHRDAVPDIVARIPEGLSISIMKPFP